VVTCRDGCSATPYRWPARRFFAGYSAQLDPTMEPLDRPANMML
jgi:hypothetical protein